MQGPGTMWTLRCTALRRRKRVSRFRRLLEAWEGGGGQGKGRGKAGKGRGEEGRAGGTAGRGRGRGGGEGEGEGRGGVLGGAGMQNAWPKVRAGVRGPTTVPGRFPITLAPSRHPGRFPITLAPSSTDMWAGVGAPITALGRVRTGLGPDVQAGGSELRSLSRYVGGRANEGPKCTVTMVTTVLCRVMGSLETGLRAPTIRIKHPTSTPGIHHTPHAPPNPEPY